MAKIKRKKKYRIRFELSIMGLAGLGIVAFCIFLWMFLLGIWAGQTVLVPPGSQTDPSLAHLASTLWEKGKGTGADQPEPAAVPEPETQAVPEVESEPEADPEQSETSFFALQVGAYSEPQRAGKVAESWQQRGYDAFFLTPEGGEEPVYRVCVGNFSNLAAANEEAGRLEETEEIEAFITLIPASKVQRP